MPENIEGNRKLIKILQKTLTRLIVRVKLIKILMVLLLLISIQQQPDEIGDDENDRKGNDCDKHLLPLECECVPINI
jgi:hypothetical protein